MKEYFKTKYKELIEKMNQKPKFYLKIGFVILFLMFAVTLIYDINVVKESKSISTVIPFHFGSQELTNLKKEQQKKEEKMRSVLLELQKFKEKHTDGTLTRNDSLRIEYIYKEYNALTQ